jgi:hypothetical protein
LNFEYGGSWFGSYSEYSLHSIFTNALKQTKQIQRGRDDCDEAYDQLGDVLDEQSKASLY